MTHMQVKGTAVLSIPRFVRERHGEEGIERWREALPPESKEIYNAPLHATEWYPLHQALIAPTEQICRLFHQGKPEGAWECGRYSAEYALSGVYKILVRFRSASYLVNRAGTVLPTYYIPSTMEVVENIKGYAVLRISEFPEMHAMVEQRIAGWIERALELCGCSDVTVKIPVSLARDDDCTEFHMTWR